VGSKRGGSTTASDLSRRDRVLNDRVTVVRALDAKLKSSVP
jgi:hypothetical protein